MSAYFPLHRTHALVFLFFSFLFLLHNSRLNYLPTAKAVGTPQVKLMEISLVTVLLCMLALYEWQFQFWGPGFEYVYLRHTTDAFFM
jgi:hypothetical protein